MPARQTPSHLKAVQGTERTDRTNSNPPSPDICARKPIELTGDAEKEWNRLAPYLKSQGLLKTPDTYTFASYCVAVQLFRHATREISAVYKELERNKHRKPENQVDESKLYVRLDKLRIQYNQASDKIESFSKKFGLTPLDRGAITAAPPRNSNDSDFA